MPRKIMQKFFIDRHQVSLCALRITQKITFLEDLMSRMAKTAIAVLVVYCFMACKSDNKPSIKTAQEKIAADINLRLQESMADIGFSGVKLKDAPKASGNTWVGSATFVYGSEKMDQDIAAFYNENTQSIFYWFSDDMQNMSEIPLASRIEATEAIAENKPSAAAPQPAQNPPSAQPTDTLGKVEKKGSTFTTFDSKGKQITYFSNPNMDLVGWGKDFFVLRSGTTFKTYDPRCRQITSLSIGGAGTASVETETFTVKVGSSSQRYDKNGRRK